jgi:hypothetical protein
MKGRILLGALLASVALCSQGFGIELLDRIVGLKNCNGSGTCQACAKVDCCEPAAKASCPEPACGQKDSDASCKRCITPVRDLFCGIKGLLECQRCGKVKCCCPKDGCDPGKPCEEVKACAPDPSCDPCAKPVRARKVCCEAKACDPACVAPKACDPCDQACAKKRCRRPILELFQGLFQCRKACCDPSCDPCAAADSGGKAEGTAPTPAPEAAPLPKAPKADPSASLQRGSIYQAARVVVQN